MVEGLTNVLLIIPIFVIIAIICTLKLSICLCSSAHSPATTLRGGQEEAGEARGSPAQGAAYFPA